MVIVTDLFLLVVILVVRLHVARDARFYSGIIVLFLQAVGCSCHSCWGGLAVPLSNPTTAPRLSGLAT